MDATELLSEFMTRGCTNRRKAISAVCTTEDAEVVMEVFGLKSLTEATTHELCEEFIGRDCGTRRQAVRDVLREEHVRVAMEEVGIDEEDPGYSQDDLDEAEEEGREKGAEEEREKLLAVFGELGWTVTPEAQARVRDYLWREHGITNVYAARMF